MMLTVSALGWVLDGKWGALEWLLPSALLYALIWLGRWVGWYAELAQIKERLGIASKPSNGGICDVRIQDRGLFFSLDK